MLEKVGTIGSLVGPLNLGPSCRSTGGMLVCIVPREASFNSSPLVITVVGNGLADPE